jgi:hypothetical protein
MASRLKKMHAFQHKTISISYCSVLYVLVEQLACILFRQVQIVSKIVHSKSRIFQLNSPSSLVQRCGFVVLEVPMSILGHDAGGQGSIVGIATGYGLDGPGSNPGGCDIFRTCLDQPWGPPSLLYNGYRFFRGVKSGRDVTLTPHPF